MVDQLAIVMFGTASIWLLATKHYRAGFLCGLLAEPFWLYTAVKHDQFGIIILAVIYAAGHARGLYNHVKNGNTKRHTV